MSMGRESNESLCFISGSQVFTWTCIYAVRGPGRPSSCLSSTFGPLWSPRPNMTWCSLSQNYWRTGTPREVISTCRAPSQIHWVIIACFLKAVIVLEWNSRFYFKKINMKILFRELELEQEAEAGALRSHVFSGAGAGSLNFPMLQDSFSFLIFF